MAYLERSTSEFKDQVSIVDCRNWSMVKQFQVCTTDAEDLSWSPDGRYIAVWDGALEYRVAIYAPDGRLVSKYQPENWDSSKSLGVSIGKWSPSGQFFAVGSHDHKVRFLNNYTWTDLIDLTAPKTVSSDTVHAFTELSADRDETVKIRSEVQCKQ